MSVYVIEEGPGGYAIRNTRTLAVVAFKSNFHKATRLAAKLNQAAMAAERTRKTPHSAPCCDCRERAETLAKVAEHLRVQMAVFAREGDARAERAIAEAVAMSKGVNTNG